MGLLSTIGSASGRAFGFTRSAVAAAADAFFNRVTLLLNTSSTNGAQNNTFLDSSTNNFTITRNGNTTQGTFTPFSQTGWSNYFNGSNTELTCTGSALSGQFTMEGWVYYTSTPSTGMTYFGISSDNGGYIRAESSTQIGFVQGAVGPSLTGSFTPVAGVWYHIAVTRNASNLMTIWVNGSSVASGTVSTSYASGTFAIGANHYSGGTTGYFPGYISNVRLVTGSALYTSSFTPSTTPLTAVSGTQILTCQSNRFVDNSSNAYALTVNGTPSVQAFSPFLPTAAYDASVVGGSGYFDGTGDYLNFTDSANDLDLGGRVASFEAWVYPTTTAGYQHFIVKTGGNLSWDTTSGIEYAIAFDVNKFYFVYNSSGSATFINGATTRKPNQWYHVVVATDASNNVALFVNGVRDGTATNAISKPTNRTLMYVGANSGGTETLTGYISGERFISGSGAYDPTQTTLTIPTAPPTAVTNTKLLLNFTNAGIIDSASKNVLETVGNAQVSTTQAKFGTTSMYFDGTGDWLLAPNRSLFDFGSGSFTVEGWFYPTTSSPTSGLITKRANSGVYAPFLIETASSLTPTFYFSTTGSSWNSIASSISFTINTWNHFAITRNGSTFTIWINGSSGGTATNSSALMTNTDAVSIGASGVNGDRPVVGYMDDVRITNGLARYTTTFTPPTAAFPLQ